MAHLIVYMPAYNEETVIGTVINSIPGHLPGTSSLDILVVNDGSSDKTEQVACRLGAKVISHKFNKGVGSAFQTAVLEALAQKADILCSIDADGQFDVKHIVDMIQPILSGDADFCIGNRFARKRHPNMPLIKYWGNHMINKIVSSASKTKIFDASCGFRAYSKECLLSLNLQGNYTYTHETILDLLNKGFHLSQVPVTVEYFPQRVSRVANNIFNYTFQTLKIIFKCLKDYSPFYFFGSISFFIFFAGLIQGLWVLLHWLQTGEITPYKSIGLISVIMCLIAVIFLVLALIADMLGRIRGNQEKILYLLKSMRFKDNS